MHHGVFPTGHIIKRSNLLWRRKKKILKLKNKLITCLLHRDVLTPTNVVRIESKSALSIVYTAIKILLPSAELHLTQPQTSLWSDPFKWFLSEAKICAKFMFATSKKRLKPSCKQILFKSRRKKSEKLLIIQSESFSYA